MLFFSRKQPEKKWKTHNFPQPNITPGKPQTQFSTQKPIRKQKLCTHKNPQPQTEQTKNQKIHKTDKRKGEKPQNHEP
jgi:hypothetical protein